MVSLPILFSGAEIKGDFLSTADNLRTRPRNEEKDGRKMKEEETEKVIITHQQISIIYISMNININIATNI